jgi:hypothetical protein
MKLPERVKNVLSREGNWTTKRVFQLVPRGQDKAEPRSRVEEVLPLGEVKWMGETRRKGKITSVLFPKSSDSRIVKIENNKTALWEGERYDLEADGAVVLDGQVELTVRSGTLTTVYKTQPTLIVTGGEPERKELVSFAPIKVKVQTDGWYSVFHEKSHPFHVRTAKPLLPIRLVIESPKPDGLFVRGNMPGFGSLSSYVPVEIFAPETSPTALNPEWLSKGLDIVVEVENLIASPRKVRVTLECMVEGDSPPDRAE